MNKCNYALDISLKCSIMPSVFANGNTKPSALSFACFFSFLGIIKYEGLHNLVYRINQFIILHEDRLKDYVYPPKI
jgi:hypothetical protein